jgi:hypothetical protein
MIIPQSIFIADKQSQKFGDTQLDGFYTPPSEKNSSADSVFQTTIASKQPDHKYHPVFNKQIEHVSVDNANIIKKISTLFHSIIIAVNKFLYVIFPCLPSETTSSSEAEKSKKNKDPSAITSESKSTKAAASTLVFSNSCPEQDFLKHICTDVDVKADCGFLDYLMPNETVGTGLKPHLDKMTPGLIVSVGTERCFFDLLLSDPMKCDGMVVRDINPRVKAYVDFNVLLLRISASREEYCALAKKPENNEESRQRIEYIRAKIENQPIPPILKDYYQKNLEAFAGIYYETSKEQWTKPYSYYNQDYFTEVNYYESDELFAKIQQYAKNGKIVSTIGSINDLSFLYNHRISVIDTSNVDSYTILDIQGCNFSDPIRVIWTSGTTARMATTYRSFQYSNLTIAERKELDQLHQHLKESLLKEASQEDWASRLSNLLCDCSEKETVPIASYSREALVKIRDFCDKHLYEVPGFGFVCLHGNEIKKLNNVPREKIEQMIKDPCLERCAQSLVKGYSYLDFKLYIEFMNIPGWKKAFEDEGEYIASNRIFVKLQEEGLLQIFIDRFGKDRIAQWSPEIQASLQYAYQTKQTTC